MKLKNRLNFEYILKSEREEKDPSVFILKELSATEASTLQGDIIKMGVTSQSDLVEAFGILNNISFAAGKIGIKNWKNVCDEDGEQINYTPQRLEDLPFNIIVEIGKEILGKSFPEFEEYFLDLEKPNEKEEETEEKKD